MTAPRRELHNPRMPGLFEQLSVLPPTVQIGAAVLMLGMGIVGVAITPASFYAWILLIVALCLGCPLLVQGFTVRRDQRIEAEEMERARAELHELRLHIEDAVERKHGVERALMKQGFTSAKVRRWIALECDIVLPDRGL